MKTLLLIFVLSVIPVGAQQSPTPQPFHFSPSLSPTGQGIQREIQVKGQAGKWRRVKIQFPKKHPTSRPLVWIEDRTHPVGSENWQAFDPRELRLTPNDFSFLAAGGDHISVQVGWIRD